jgi:hypothetical protein
MRTRSDPFKAEEEAYDGNPVDDDGFDGTRQVSAGIVEEAT